MEEVCGTTLRRVQLGLGVGHHRSIGGWRGGSDIVGDSRHGMGGIVPGKLVVLGGGPWISIVVSGGRVVGGRVGRTMPAGGAIVGATSPPSLVCGRCCGSVVLSVSVGGSRPSIVRCIVSVIAVVVSRTRLIMLRAGVGGARSLRLLRRLGSLIVMIHHLHVAVDGRLAVTCHC